MEEEEMGLELTVNMRYPLKSGFDFKAFLLWERERERERERGV